MKYVMAFLVAFLFSAALTFFLTRPAEKPKPTVTPLSVSAFSMEDAPKNSLSGFTSSFSGEVYWLSRVATEPAQMKFQRAIHQGENVITKESGAAEIRFPDALAITMLPYSEIAVIQTLPGNIVMKQIGGTVDYTKLGNVPVSIQISDLLINLDKGIVQVSADPDLSVITVAVEDGVVKVAYVDADDNSSVETITAGKSFVYDTLSEIGSVK